MLFGSPGVADLDVEVESRHRPPHLDAEWARFEFIEAHLGGLGVHVRLEIGVPGEGRRAEDRVQPKKNTPDNPADDF